MNSENSELISIKIAKANDILHEVEILIENKLWNTAVNRLYYACFYAVSALLISIEIVSKTHAGTRQMFGLHFIKPNKISENHGDFYSTIFHMRQSADYEDLVVYEAEDVIELITPAKDLIESIEKILLENNAFSPST